MGRTEEECLQVFQDNQGYKPWFRPRPSSNFDDNTPLYTIKYNDDNVVQKPHETTFGAVVEMCVCHTSKSRYQTTATTETEQKKLKRCAVSLAVIDGKPYLGFVMGRTEEKCLQVYQDNSKYKPRKKQTNTTLP